MYIKINGSDEKYYDILITSFKTQHSNDGIVVTGDIPHTDKGFVVYDDNDKVINDFSDYVYQYGDNENEYTKTEEEVNYGEATFTPIPPSAFDRLSQRVSALNNQVNAITPYTESKLVYIDDTECVFENIYKAGNIDAYLVVNGQPQPCKIETYENYVVVTFDKLEDVGTVTISIQ